MYIEVFGFTDDKDIDLYLGLIDISIHIPKILRYRSYNRSCIEIQKAVRKYFGIEIGNNESYRGEDFDISIEKKDYLKILVNDKNEKIIRKIADCINKLSENRRLIISSTKEDVIKDKLNNENLIWI